MSTPKCPRSLPRTPHPSAREKHSHREHHRPRPGRSDHRHRRPGPAGAPGRAHQGPFLRRSAPARPCCSRLAASTPRSPTWCSSSRPASSVTPATCPPPKKPNLSMTSSNSDLNKPLPAAGLARARRADDRTRLFSPGRPALTFPPQRRTSLARASPGLLLAPAAAAPPGRSFASLFYNVTGIETVHLPNAVRITIRTDGAVQFGGDLAQIRRHSITSSPSRISTSAPAPAARPRPPAVVRQHRRLSRRTPPPSLWARIPFSRPLFTATPATHPTHAWTLICGSSCRSPSSEFLPDEQPRRRGLTTTISCAPRRRR